ncbi:MAG: hypothetical protein ACTSU2_14810 [Promethearchaeota archaeon]
MKFEYLKNTDFSPEDSEWAEDWKRIRQVFEKIDELEKIFSEFDVSYYRELQQRTLILNLKKYAWSLQGLILEKYSSKKPDIDELI